MTADTTPTLDDDTATLVRIAVRLGLDFHAVPPLGGRHLCGWCDEQDIRPAVALVRYRGTDGLVYEHGACMRIHHLGGAILSVLPRFAALLIPSGVVLPGDPPLTHIRPCTSWDCDDPARCDCCDGDRAPVAEPPAPPPATYGAACDDIQSGAQA